MNKWKLLALIAATGALLPQGACLANVGYELLNTFTTYLPDLIAAATGTSTA